MTETTQVFPPSASEGRAAGAVRPKRLEARPLHLGADQSPEPARRAGLQTEATAGGLRPTPKAPAVASLWRGDSAGKLPARPGLTARALLGGVWVYQQTLSPLLPALFGPAVCGCRFHPTCSQYAAGAVRAHGALAGTWLAARRLLKCTPWHPGGNDPVPPRRGKAEVGGVPAPRVRPIMRGSAVAKAMADKEGTPPTISGAPAMSPGA